MLSFPHFFIAIVSLFISLHPAEGQITGIWKTIGDDDKKDKALVEVFEKDGLIYGRVIKLLPDAKVTHCDKCDGEMKGKSIEGMTILSGLKKTANGGEDGKILDPSVGKTYTCFAELVEPDKLKIRGYIGIPTLGKTVYWYRKK